MRTARVILTLATALLATACAPMYMTAPRQQPTAFAPIRDNPVGRWDAVMSLDARMIVGVLTADGVAHTGRVTRAGMQWLRLIENGSEIEILRGAVARVDLLSGDGDAAARIAAGAGLGAVMAAGTEMFFSAAFGGRVRLAWQTAALGAAGGAFGAAVDAAGRRQQRTIYVSPQLIGH